MIAKICETSGLKVGLYTSPHLERYNERITINSEEISDEALLHYTSMIETICTQYSLHITFFDAFTTIAFLHFYYNNIDIAVIETGLGGRLDSTNVITPLVVS